MVTLHEIDDRNYFLTGLVLALSLLLQFGLTLFPGTDSPANARLARKIGH